MKYSLDDDDSKKEDACNDFLKGLKNLDELIDKHADYLINEDYNNIANWLTLSTGQILGLIDDLEDKDLSKKLSNLFAVIIGAAGKAVIDLKTENEMLKHDILYELQGDVDPELN